MLLQFYSFILFLSLVIGWIQNHYRWVIRAYLEQQLCHTNYDFLVTAVFLGDGAYSLFFRWLRNIFEGGYGNLDISWSFENFLLAMRWAILLHNVLSPWCTLCHESQNNGANWSQTIPSIPKSLRYLYFSS